MWREVRWAIEDHWRWMVVVPPITVFTVWSGVAGASRLGVPAPIPPRIPGLGRLSPAWQVGVLLGAIVMCCAWWGYWKAANGDGGDDDILFGLLPELGAGAIVLITTILCCAAAQRGGSTEWLFIPLVGLICSAALTLTFRVAAQWA